MALQKIIHTAVSLLFMLAVISPATAREKLAYNQQQLFRKWAGAIALGIFAEREGDPGLKDGHINAGSLPRWQRDNHDCAGFIRYLIWEAFMPHPYSWHARQGNRLSRSLPALPRSEKPSLFNAAGEKVTYVNAEQLMKYNTALISRSDDNPDLQTGDILFYRTGPGSYHSMLLVRDIRSGRLLVIYHTGRPVNELRMVYFTDLFEHSDGRWHPHEGNENFLGFYRLYFLD